MQTESSTRGMGYVKGIWAGVLAIVMTGVVASGTYDPVGDTSGEMTQQRAQADTAQPGSALAMRQ